MKIGMEMEAVYAEVMRQSRPPACADFLVPTRDLVYRTQPDKPEGVLLLPVTPEVIYPDGFVMTKRARSQLAKVCGIPEGYFELCRTEQPSLLDNNVNTWLQAKRTSEVQMIRTLDGAARAVLSDSYRTIDNWEVLQILLPMIDELRDELGLKYESINLSPEKLCIKLLSQRVRCDVVPGDAIQAGVMISNSEVGAGRLIVQSLVYRLLCENGLIRPDATMKKSHIGRRQDFDENFSVNILSEETRRADNRALMLRARDVARAAFDRSQLELAASQLRATIGMRIETEPTKVVKQLSNRFALNETERAGVTGSLLASAQLNAYGLVNAVTHFAQIVEDYDRSTELEEIGGHLLALPRKDWTALLKGA